MIIGMVGLPRCGKSTLAKKLVNLCKFVVINRDSVRYKVYGQRYFKGGEDFVRGTTSAMVSILSDQSVHMILDETNITEHKREEWYKISRDEIYWIFFYPTTDLINACHDRADRMGQKDLHGVIDSMLGNLEHPIDNVLAVVDQNGEISKVTYLGSPIAKTNEELINFLELEMKKATS